MNISFAMTTRQVEDGEKDITRRIGWKKLKAGTRLQAIVKGQGLKKGEKVQRIRIIEVVSVRREPLRRMIDEPAYGASEVRREGFPELTAWAFVEMFCVSHDCVPETIITRIEFRYVD
jgi:hypothetical protein